MAIHRSKTCSFCFQPAAISNLGLYFYSFNLCYRYQCWERIIGKPSKKSTQQITKLSKQLFKLHQLSGWECKIGVNGDSLVSAIETAAVCQCSKKQITISTWAVSLNQLPAIKQILLHEIAHALVGAQHQHNKVWKDQAKKIGYLYTATGKRSKESRKKVIA